MRHAARDEHEFLLFNCSNLPWRPIFPYAFVQVSEVCRRNGLRVRRVDLLNWKREDWPDVVRRVIYESRPKLVGIHLRQVDSVNLSDYLNPVGTEKAHFRTYFPVQFCRDLVDTIRSITSAPIMVGGFGYTTHANLLSDYLQADYGCVGAPDAIFANFDRLIERNDLESIPNLVLYTSGSYRFNASMSFGPSHELEYTEEIFGELTDFYGRDTLFGLNPPTVAVEIARGCPFSCYFCTEPGVKGKRVIRRDLTLVEEEVARLRARGIWRIWFICSELNTHGSALGLELSEIILRQNRKFGGRSLEWSAYILPNIDPHDLALLESAGFVGAMNDVLSLDDENLKQARVPYRAAQAVRFIRAVSGGQATAEQSPDIVASTATPLGNEKFVVKTPKQLASVISLFLGNPYATPRTLVESLRVIDREGLQPLFSEGHVISSTRVFDTPVMRGLANEAGAVSFGPEGERQLDLRYPTFHFPQYLLHPLGTPDRVIHFLQHLADTFMSFKGYRVIDWVAFLSESDTLTLLRRAVDEVTNTQDADITVEMLESVERIECSVDSGKLSATAEVRQLNSSALAIALERIVALLLGNDCLADMLFAVAGFRLSPSGDWPSPLATTTAIYERHDSSTSLFADADLRAPSQVASAFVLRYLITRYSIRFDDGYRGLILGVEEESKRYAYH